jgi:superfamily II DNA or RNA helicase
LSYEAYSKISLRDDPTRLGTILGKTRPRGRELTWLVDFGNERQWVPESQLVRHDEILTPIEAFEQGRLSGAKELRRAITQARLSGRLVDTIYSLGITETDFYPHQYRPVLKLLDSASTGLLVADEVGLGKTIEAGLVWTELRARFDYRRLLVLCPAVLREKWQLELERRFGVSAQIEDAAGVLKHLQKAASGQAEFAVIASLQGVRPTRRWSSATNSRRSSDRLGRFLADAASGEPLVDLLVVDEAHYLRNPETQTSRAGRLLRDVAEYALFLSATPIHLKSADLFTLLHLLDQDTFGSEWEFDYLQKANAPLNDARGLVLTGKLDRNRLARLLENAAQHPLLNGHRQLEGLLESLRSGPAEVSDPASISEISHALEQANLLSQVVTRTRRRDVEQLRVIRHPVTVRTRMSVVERDFYEAVTAVVRDYARRLENSVEGFLLVTPQRQMSSSMAAALEAWRKRAGLGLEEELYEDFGVDDTAPVAEPGPLLRELLDATRRLGDPKELRKHDSKYSDFLREVRVAFEHDSQTKILVFSYFRATLSYLSERLAEDGVRAFVMHGGTEDKTTIVRTFLECQGAAVLLSSEVGSEGLDLQDCAIVVNYDLPWNPMKVEQRIGRIDRLGQKADKISIWNLIYADTIDERIYERLFLRLRLFERTLGGLEPILGEQVQRLTRDLLASDLTPAQEEERITQTAVALENRRREEERLEDEAPQLAAHGDYILQTIHQARELDRAVSEQDLFFFLSDYLTATFPGSEFSRLQQDGFWAEIRLSRQAQHSFSSFLRDRGLSTRTALADFSVDRVVAEFKNRAVTRPARGFETISQFHPLVRFVATEVGRRTVPVRPAVAVRMALSGAHPVRTGDFAFLVDLWAAEGLHPVDKLFFCALDLDRGSLLARLEAERLISLAAARGRTWETARSDLDLELVASRIDEQCIATAQAEFDSFREALRRRTEDQTEVRLRSASSRFERQVKSLKLLLEQQARAGSRIARATEGRLKKLLARRDEILARIEGRKSSSLTQTELALGVVRVEPQK